MDPGGEGRVEQSGPDRASAAPLPDPPSTWSEARSAPEWAQERPDRPPAGRVGPYLLGPMLGEGGMGTVYLAWDAVLGRRVALKLVKGESPDFIRRMIQEARLQARVEHPAVCRIYQIGEDAARPYIAMQFIQGANLAEWAPHLGLEGKLRLMIQVADAVNAAHRMGLIHRDLKPTNLLVEQDEAGVLRPFVMDFGLARDTSGMDVTQHGIAVGSPSYMAPEQATGGKVDERTDVYGLGATLYEILSGRPPFRGVTVVDTVRMVMERDAPMLRALDPGIPPDLESVVHKCLDKDPARRYGSAKDLRDDLERCLDGEPVEARRQNRWRRALRRLKRNRTLSLVVSGAAVLVLAAGAFAAWTWKEARERALWAERFGQQVREMDATLRNAHLFPLHDLRPERADVQARLDRIQEQMQRLGPASQGPGWFALGQGRLMLDLPGEARRALEAAWNRGYQTPEVAAALADALAELHRQALEDAHMIRRESLRQATVEQARQHYQPAIAAALERVRQGTGLSALQAALQARAEGRSSEAARLAREAFDRQRWNYEARIDEIEALFQAARDAADRAEEQLVGPRLDEAERLLGWLKETARSDPRVYLRDAQVRLLRIRLGTLDRPLEQNLREGLAALDRALKANPGSGEPHLLRANLFRWMAVRQQALPVQAAYWMDRAIEAAAAAAADPAIRPRARACQASLLLEKAFRLEETGRDATATVTESCALWRKALGDGLEGPALRFQGAMEVALGQLILADLAAATGRDPLAPLGEARDSLQGLLRSQPDNGEALLELARVLRRTGDARARRGQDPEPDYRAARDALDRCMGTTGNIGSAWNSLGALAWSRALQAQRRSGDPEPHLRAAATAFRNATKARPRSVLYVINLLEVRCRQGQLALRQGGDPGSAIRDADDLLRAAQALEPGPELGPDLDLAASQVLALRAEAALLQGRPAEALLREAEGQARPAVRGRPRSPAAWATLGHSLALAARAALPGAEAEARRAYARAAGLDAADPDLPTALGQLDLLAAVGRLRTGADPGPLLASAEGHAARALALDPTRAEALGLRACIFLARAKAAERQPAERDLQAGRAAEAARAALALAPRQDQAAQVLARLEALSAGSSVPPDPLERRWDPALDYLVGRVR